MQRTEDIVELNAITADAVVLPVATNAGIRLDVMRLDKIDAVISGNKWFKLRYYLEQSISEGRKTLVSFGGAYSNHIVAVAAAASRLGISSVGYIRGERPAQLSPTLHDAEAMGMLLHFLNRNDFQRTEDPAFLEQLAQVHLDACIIPMGGAGPAGIQGAASIAQCINMRDYTHVCCTVGTGTMAAGLLSATKPGQALFAFPVLKGFSNWKPPIAASDERGSWNIITGFEFGGYAKHPDRLLQFMNEWYATTGIPSDFVYTGKLFYGIIESIKAGLFPDGSRILAIHSGGLQGNRSLAKGQLIF